MTKEYDAPQFSVLLSVYEYETCEKRMLAEIDANKSYFQPCDHAYLKHIGIHRVNKLAMQMRLVGALLLTPELSDETRLRVAVDSMCKMGAFASFKARKDLIDVATEGRMHLDSLGARECRLGQMSGSLAIIEGLARHSLYLRHVEQEINGEKISHYVMDINPLDVESHIVWVS